MSSFWQSTIDSTQIISGQLSLTQLTLTPDQHPSLAEYVKGEKGVLLTEWVAPTQTAHRHAMTWSVLYWLPQQGLWCASALLNHRIPRLRDLSHYFPVASRLQRAIYELTRIPTQHAPDRRYWLNHGHFPLGILTKKKPPRLPSHSYTFQKISGEGVHEIPVGPVHAGVIEPGHFRFSVVGERILKLEERLGYTHKGIHQLLKDKPLTDAAKLIARVSGDSTIGYSYAFAMACEHALHHQVNLATQYYRAILLERERLANHIGDIGAIVNDTSLPSLQSSFQLLKETLLRYNVTYSGHRYGMDAITPLASITRDVRVLIEPMHAELNTLIAQWHELKAICDQHYGFQDRIIKTGILETDTAKQWGIVGMAARASGIAMDLRCDHPYAPYDQLSATLITDLQGDVAARVSVRFSEWMESLSLIKQCLEKCPSASESTTRTPSLDTGLGVGCVEGWRGPIVVVVSIKNKRVEWCHFHDPSWQNWLALEVAVLGNIVADFPLINQSFNLSYSGHDS